jgi:hypothetical protein
MPFSFSTNSTTSARSSLSLLILAIVALGCSRPWQRCEPEHRFGLPFDQVLSPGTYRVAPTLYTPRGLAVDPSGQPVDLAALDALTDDVEACLARTFPGGEIPEAVWHSGSCEWRRFGPIKRRCITVKLAADWRVGVSGDQLLPHGNGGSCTDKGHGSAPCSYRVALQDDLTIVVPPSLQLYAEGLIRIATGCHRVWSAPELAACVLPPKVRA